MPPTRHPAGGVASCWFGTRRCQRGLWVGPPPYRPVCHVPLATGSWHRAPPRPLPARLGPAQSKQERSGRCYRAGAGSGDIGYTPGTRGGDLSPLPGRTQQPGGCTRIVYFVINNVQIRPNLGRGAARVAPIPGLGVARRGGIFIRVFLRVSSQKSRVFWWDFVGETGAPQLPAWAQRGHRTKPRARSLPGLLPPPSFIPFISIPSAGLSTKREQRQHRGGGGVPSPRPRRPLSPTPRVPPILRAL